MDRMRLQGEIPYNGYRMGFEVSVCKYKQINQKNMIIEIVNSFKNVLV